MVIDRAAVQDIAALSALLSLLFAQEAEFVPDPEVQARGLARIIDNPQVGVILVARDGASVVAMVNLLFTVSSALGETVALLEDMIVAPHARGAGVGSRLLEAALSQARAHDCRRVTLLTDRSNEAAQRFYARHGFARSDMVPLRRALAGKPA